MTFLESVMFWLAKEVAGLLFLLTLLAVMFGLAVLFGRKP